MEINFKETGETTKELEATLTYEELQPYFEAAYQKFRKQATVPGFRKGKVPLGMLKRMYGEAIEYKELEKIAEQVFKQSVAEHKIRVADVGSIIDMDYKPKENFFFKISFECFAEIELTKYKDFSFKDTRYIVNENSVDEEIHKILFDRATKEMDGQVLDKDYIVTADVNEVDEAGNIIIGKSEKDVAIYVGDKHLDENLFKALQNIKEGEEKTVELKNKEKEFVTYRLTCKKIEKLVYPELNAEFYKKMTGKEDVITEEDFKMFIKKQMEDAYNNVSEEMLERKVITEVVNANEFKIPDGFVNRIIKEDYESHLKSQKKPEGELTEAEYTERKKPDTVFYLKWHMIKDKIVEIEKLEAGENEIMKIAEKNAAMYNLPADKLFEIYKNNADIKEKALEKRVIDYIIENSTKETEEIDISNPKHDHDHDHSHNHNH